MLITCPFLSLTALSSSEHVTDLSEVKNKIAELYSTLNIEHYQVEREQELLAKLENLKTKIEPLEKVLRLLALHGNISKKLVFTICL